MCQSPSPTFASSMRLRGATRGISSNFTVSAIAVSCSALICATCSTIRNGEIRGYPARRDRKSTRLNSSHTVISYAVFCLKNKIQTSELLADIDRGCLIRLQEPAVEELSMRCVVEYKASVVATIQIDE